jgi:hypothetical protein
MSEHIYKVLELDRLVSGTGPSGIETERDPSAKAKAIAKAHERRTVCFLMRHHPVFPRSPRPAGHVVDGQWPWPTLAGCRLKIGFFS